ncbi:MAG: hypothetical protein V1914_00110 [archaeon]
MVKVFDFGACKSYSLLREKYAKIVSSTNSEHGDSVVNDYRKATLENLENKIKIAETRRILLSD